jgi:hypothetical protein
MVMWCGCVSNVVSSSFVVEDEEDSRLLPTAATATAVTEVAADLLSATVDGEEEKSRR